MIYNESKYNSHWDKKKLNELGDFDRGKSRHRPRDDKRLFEEGKYPLIQTGEVKAANLYITSHNAEYGDFGLAQSKMWPTGTLCITIAANIAETALLGYPMCFPDSVIGFNAFPDKTSELFMHYVFTYIRKAIQNSTGGSIQDNINKEYLEGLDFKIPPKPYQDKIVKILSSIDKKIDLNNTANEEFEKLIKTIYDYWFVQFEFQDEQGKSYKSSGGEMIWSEELKREIPKDWRIDKLEYVVERFATGLNPRQNFVLGNGENFYVTIKNIDYGKLLLNDKCDKVDDEAILKINRRSNLLEGDVLFSGIGTIGRTYLIMEKPQNWNISESIFTLRPNKNHISSEYLYSFLSSIEFQSFVKRASTGSTQKGIRMESLQGYRYAIPNKKIIDLFTNRVKSYFIQINKNSKENEELLKLRDWLLPMLMTGQVTF